MIELRNVQKTYKDSKGREVQALRGISYKFPQTGVVFIVGKSGSGKSTLLNLLGLLDSYDNGELLVDGRPSNDLAGRERDTYRALNIGFVFQEFHIIEKYTIGQNISLALEIGQQDAGPEQIASALSKVGLAGFENRYARGVSGGQKQRVAIARAIVKNPKIILADEPTGNLDSVTSREIFDLLRELSRENLVIVISHDAESAHRYADEIVELADGKIVDIYNGDGTTDTVRLAVDAVNKKEVDALLDDGKKVVLVKKKEKPPVPIETPPVNTIDTSKRVRLPFSSSLKLSMLSMRAKWVRMLFTVFLSMFAIALFGFADIIGQYSTNRIMAQEIERSGLPFVPVALMETDESSFIQIQERRTITEQHLEHFDALGLPYAKQYAFPIPVMPGTRFRYMFPNERDSDMLGYFVHGVVEVDSPEYDNQPNSLGLLFIRGSLAADG
ncbi:MAG: ABC transporter ATP-binding protein [Firmicutes bacterium]|nr:ABC transporter ATP-binding protein [Bacillota bacterium]